MSQIGGITPARKIAAMAELYNVRTAWHGPNDTSPVGHAANMMLNLIEKKRKSREILVISVKDVGLI